jgi:hypothetical protein
MKMPLFLKKYFWDVDFSRLDFRKNPTYVSARILEYGDIKALKWLFGISRKSEIKKVVMKSRQLSPKTANFWSLFFNINRGRIECLRKSYQKMQKSHWPG